MTALPKAIQAQVEAADQIHQQVYGDGAQSAPVAPETPPSAEPAAPDLVAQPAPAPQPAPVAPTPVQDDPWERRYAALQGKYNAEVPRLAQELKEAKTLLAQALESRKAPEPAKANEPLVSPKDADAFGSDLMEAVVRVATRVALEQAAAAEARIRKELESVRGEVGQVSERHARSAEQLFWDRVVELVPDWEAVDNDSRWHTFLNSTPDYSTLTFRQMAEAAIGAGNADKVAKLVDTWKGTLQATPAPAPAAPTPPQPSAPGGQRPELERQVTPTTSRGSNPPAPAPKIWSRQDYESAYDPRNVQLYGAEQAARMQADADQAVAENRVRWY